MTGPENYRAAESILANLKGSDGAIRTAVQIAQVHATLAQAAATALGRYSFETGLPIPDRDAWYRVASEGPADKARRKAAELDGEWRS